MTPPANSKPSTRRSSHLLDLRSGPGAHPPRRPAPMQSPRDQAPALGASPAAAEEVSTSKAPTAPRSSQSNNTAKPVKPAAGHHKARSLWRNLAELAQYPLIALAALAAAYSTAFGQWIVLGFVIIAIVTRRRSQLTFGAALFLLITIPLFQLLGQSGIAQNVAVYVFELFVFGTVQAIWEIHLKTEDNLA